MKYEMNTCRMLWFFTTRSLANVFVFNLHSYLNLTVMIAYLHLLFKYRIRSN